MDSVEMMDSCEEMLMCCSDNVETSFDRTVGYIEDIIIGDDLELMLKGFMEKYYTIFDEEDENKLEYMTIFQEYQELIERYLESELMKRQPGFTMSKFIEQLMQRQNELDGEVFQILLSLTDFVLFKDLMLDYKNAKSSRLSELNDDLIITSLSKLKFSPG